MVGSIAGQLGQDGIVPEITNKQLQRRCGGPVVRVPASRSPVLDSILGPGGASPQCGLRGGRSHCNNE